MHRSLVHSPAAMLSASMLAACTVDPIHAMPEVALAPQLRNAPPAQPDGDQRRALSAGDSRSRN